MLDSLQLDMDDTHTKMLKVDNKLKHIVANTSQTKMWCIIIIEIILLCMVISMWAADNNPKFKIKWDWSD